MEAFQAKHQDLLLKGFQFGKPQLAAFPNLQKLSIVIQGAASNYLNFGHLKHLQELNIKVNGTVGESHIQRLFDNLIVSKNGL